MEFEGREGRMPTLDEISGQFAFYGPEEAAVVLSIMEADPRMPKNFVQRDPQTGELTGINKEAVEADAGTVSSKSASQRASSRSSL